MLDKVRAAVVHGQGDLLGLGGVVEVAHDGLQHLAVGVDVAHAGLKAHYAHAQGGLILAQDNAHHVFAVGLVHAGQGAQAGHHAGQEGLLLPLGVDGADVGKVGGGVDVGDLLLGEVDGDLVDGLGLVGRQADDQVVLAALGEHAVVGQEVAGALGFHIVKLDAEVFFRLLGAGVGHIVEVLVAQAAGGQDDAHLQGVAVRGAAGGAGRWGVLAAAAGGQAEGEGTGQREREQFLCVHDRVPPLIHSAQQGHFGRARPKLTS